MKNSVLRVKEIPVPRSSCHEMPKHDVLPSHEFTLGLIGVWLCFILAPKGCGKTTMIVNLLEFYKNYFHSILIFSPTVQSDEKWDYVKGRRYLTQNVKLQKFVQKMKGKSEDKVNEVVPYRTDASAFDGLVNPYDESFDGKIDEDCFFCDYSPKTLEKIANEQMVIKSINLGNGEVVKEIWC
jgi:thymidine kinase